VIRDLYADGEPRIAVVLGTGPSLTREQIELVERRRLRTFGCNNSIFATALDVHLACNWQWWRHYYPQVVGLPGDKWTTRPELIGVYPGVDYIMEKWEPGLSTDPSYICAHHGSGPQILNMALHYGAKKIILLGWDMRFPGKVSDREYKGRRHYFGSNGEYPASMQHWPRTGPEGELTGLIDEMRTIEPAAYGIDIVNCTPNTALDCFRRGQLDAETSMDKGAN
jgi:hypothetical protein